MHQPAFAALSCATHKLCGMRLSRRLLISLAARSTLTRQTEPGAPAQIFISAVMAPAQASLREAGFIAVP